jgi:hypothetical protein
MALAWGGDTGVSKVTTGPAGNFATYYCRLERRLYLLCHQSFPVDVLGKEGVIFDVLCAIHT